MDDFIEKSAESFKAGEILGEKSLYSSAVSRYYYNSVYQHIIPIVNLFKERDAIICQELNISRATRHNLGSHDKTIRCFEKFLVKNYSALNLTPKEINSIIGEIKRLKSQRHKADYQSSVITIKELNFAKKVSSFLRNKVILNRQEKIIELIQ